MTPGSGGLYASGGYTGPGGRLDPAGIVHRGEDVFSAASVNRIGLGNLDSMHRGALKGYDGGGYVSPTPYAHPQASNSNAVVPKMNVVINNNHAGAEVETHQGEDGSFEVVVNALEGRMADRMLQGRGSIGMASTARAAGKHLRG